MGRMRLRQDQGKGIRPGVEIGQETLHQPIAQVVDAGDGVLDRHPRQGDVEQVAIEEADDARRGAKSSDDLEPAFGNQLADLLPLFRVARLGQLLGSARQQRPDVVERRPGGQVEDAEAGKAELRRQKARGVGGEEQEGPGSA
jgi:hypothetical protein